MNKPSLLISSIVLSSILSNSDACSSFVLSNSNTSNPSSILVKVRDASFPTTKSKLATEDLRFFHDQGYPYVGLMFSQTDTNPGVRENIAAGTNNQGVSVAVNFATSQNKRIKTLYGSIASRETDILRAILEQAKTIDDAKQIIKQLDNQNKLVPCLITISDKQNGLIVEIGADDQKNIRYEVKSTDTSGSVYVANQFDTPMLSTPTYNVSISKDSANRLQRLTELFSKPVNVTTASAMSIAKDYASDEMNSIFRYPTRATYMANTSNGVTNLWIEFTDIGQIYNRAAITLNETFWSSHKDGDVIVASDSPFVPEKHISTVTTY